MVNGVGHDPYKMANSFHPPKPAKLQLLLLSMKTHQASNLYVIFRRKSVAWWYKVGWIGFV